MDSSVEQIKQKLPIADVVSQYVKLTKAGKNLSARCPFHKEKTPSFNVSPERNAYYCFGCGEKGDIFTFVEKMEGVDFRGALRILAERAGVELKQYTGEKGPNKDEKERMYTLQDDAAALFVAQLQNRKDISEYLHKRGLSDETISKWRIGYALPEWRVLSEHLKGKAYTEKELELSGLAIKPEKEGSGVYDRFRGRIMFPINDAGGRVIGFSGRFFEAMPASPTGRKDVASGSSEKEPAKYVNSPETPLFHKSHVLYGFDKARGPMRRSDFAVIVEGQMDLLMMHQCGFPNAVAASGTALTSDHLRAIAHTTKRLVLALDSDEAGVRSALRSAQLAFGQGFDLRIAAFPEGSDPADVGKEDPEALKRAVRSSQTAVEFFLNYLRGRAKDERAFRKLAEEQVLPLIASMQSQIEQAHFIQITARTLGLPEESVRAEVAKTKQSPQTGNDGVVQKEEQSLEAIPRIYAAAAFILFSGEKEHSERLKELFGEDKMKRLTELLETDRERLLFLSESEEGANIEELFSLITTALLKEDIEKVRSEEREAKAEGNDEKAQQSAIRLKELTRKLHGLSP